MLRPLALLAATALVAAACGGDDTADDTDSARDATATTVPATVASDVTDSTGGSIPDTTISPDECVDTADPANFPVDGRPRAVRPCELPTELVVQTVREGTGPEAGLEDTIIVDYVGIRAEDGTQFDASYDREIPIDFALGRGSVIQGWDEGMLGARAGEALRLDIPAELAYGENPPAGSPIEAGDALTFVIEVRAVVPAVAPEDAPLDLEIVPSVGATEVTTTDIVVGDGEPIELGDTAVVHVLLVRGDNEVVLFDTWDRQDPLQIIMEEGQTLPGIFEGIQGATVGTLRVITIPPDEAFGPQGETGLGLPAGIDLIVVAEVMGVY